MLILQQHNEARGLGVEEAGRVEHGVVDQLLDGGIGDRRLFVESVDGATVFHRVHE